MCKISLIKELIESSFQFSHRGRLAPALATYCSLPAHYAPHMWSSLESFALLRALNIHSELQQTKDTEWIHIVLGFLKTVVECPEVESLVKETNFVEYISSLLQSLKTASTLETGNWCSPYTFY
jgi:hypothetical protein